METKYVVNNSNSSNTIFKHQWRPVEYFTYVLIFVLYYKQYYFLLGRFRMYIIYLYLSLRFLLFSVYCYGYLFTVYFSNLHLKGIYIFANCTFLGLAFFVLSSFWEIIFFSSGISNWFFLYYIILPEEISFVSSFSIFPMLSWPY